MNSSSVHQFHIPVLGLGFSIDTPLKVAKYGISSVISLVDDTLMEKLREFYSKNLLKEYNPISNKDNDSRARRVTAYLNLIDEIVKDQFENLKNSAFSLGSELNKYFEMLPNLSILRIKYQEMLESKDENLIRTLQKWLKDNMKCGSIDVNIMTKVDKINYSNGKVQPVEYNDAHAALRGFALSHLESSIVFSAGLNPKLFSYLETFNDFYPDSEGNFKKKIIIKVSDYRSAAIQGKFLAKKGLWVSEYRIESGLNCGGHAFPTNGLLLGPILNEFKEKKEELFKSVSEIYIKSINGKNLSIDSGNLNIDITVQGGIGNSNEQDFLINYYKVASVGWGSPFLLVPEVTNVDSETLQKLSEAGEKELYLSEVSPLGISFNNLKNNSKDLEKDERSKNNIPGSSCQKKFLISNKDFSDKPVCTASISFLSKKIRELKAKFTNSIEYDNEVNKLTEKVCLCEGLAVSALIVNNISNPKHSNAVSICPGPNLAYFSKITSLHEMVDHIYGRIDLVTNPDRPNMFVKELSLYVEYFIKKIEENYKHFSNQTEESLKSFYSNLKEGIEYYKTLVPEMSEETEAMKEKFLKELARFEEKLISAFTQTV